MTYQEKIVALYAGFGIKVSQDWSGALMADGNAPETCPVCCAALVEVERLDSGDWNMEILMMCPMCENVVWDTGKGYIAN